MARIYHGTAISKSNDTYVVELWNGTTPASPDASVELIIENFEFNYDKPESEGFKDKAPFGIMPSDVTVGFTAMPVSDMLWSSTVRDALEALATNEEQKWAIRVTKNGSFYWAGRVLCDQIHFPFSDKYEFICEISARDGLNIMQDYYVDATMFSISSATRESGIVMIAQCLETAGLFGYFGSDVFADAIATTNASFPGSNVGKTLAFSTFHRASFIDNFDVTLPTAKVKYVNCKDAVNEILKIFGARMFLSNGMYWITQANQYDGATIAYTTYTSAGVLNTYNSSLSHRVTTGMTIRPCWEKAPDVSYQKPIRRIEVQWDAENAELFERTSPSTTAYTATTTNILTGTVPGYLINLKARISFSKRPLSYYEYYVKWYFMNLQSATYYYWNGSTWASYGGSPKYMVAQVGLTNGSTLTEDITIDETCPEIGTGSIAFGFEVLEKINPVKYTNATGLAWTGSTSSTNYAFTFMAAVSQSYTTGDYTNKYPQKFGINVDAPRDTNSTLLEYPVRYYDGTSTKDVGGVMVFNGTTYVYPGNWSATWHSETGLLQAVLAANITGLYTNFLKVQNGTWHDTGTYHPAKTLYFDSVNWIFNGGKYTPHTDSWNGEWIGLTGNYALYSSDGSGVRTVQTKDSTLKDKLLTNEREMNALRWLVGNIGQRILIPEIINTAASGPATDPGTDKTYFVQLFYDYSATEFNWDIVESSPGGGANLGYTASATNGIVTSDSGTDATIPLATGTDAGLLAPAEKTLITNADLSDLIAQWKSADATGPATLDFHEDTDNGTNKIVLSGQSSMAVDRVIYLPDAAGTIALVTSTDVFQNKTIDLTDNTVNGTKAEFDTACSDGNFLYVGDVTQYTDELAQDAVGAMIDGTLTYVDGTPLLQRAALTGAVTASAGSNTTALGSFTISQLNTAVSDADVLINTATTGVGNTPTSSTTTTITHSLGRTPTIIRISGKSGFTSNAAATPTTSSEGCYTSLSGNTCIYQGINGTTTIAAASSTAFAIFLDTSVGNNISGVIQNLTSTTFDIVWTETGTHTRGVYLWEAQ